MFPNLFNPESIGSLRLSNRIVMPAMNTRLPTEDGYPTDRTRAYYEERAKGGAGLLIFESTYPAHPHPYRYRLTDDGYVDPLRSVVDRVHDAGGTIAIQMNIHRGTADHLDPLAPSSLVTPAGDDVAAITRARIDELVEQYAAGAARAQRAGFDGIEIHAASGYLLQQFLSPLTNRRTDEYGGSLRGRTRFATDLLDAVRDQVASDYPVWFRIPGDEFLDGGITTDGAREIAGVLAAAGSDALHVTAGHNWNDKIVPSGYVERGVYAPLAANVRDAVDIPVIAVGRINDPAVADAIVESESADFTAMGRAHLADPHIARKAKAGEVDRIRRCVGGLEGCWDKLNGAPVTCTVNARLGQESDPIRSADDSKRVAVIGGGPAGLETARVAGRRGHEVTVYEREGEIGGQLRWARHAPGKSEYDELLTFFRAELDTYDVSVRCSHDVDPTDLSALDADAVVIATGAKPRIPALDGLSEAVTNDAVKTPGDVLGTESFPFESALVHGGNEVGCDVALYLAQRGIETSVVADGELLSDRITDTPKPGMRHRVLRRLRDTSHLLLLPDSHVAEVRTSSGTATIRGEGGTRTVPADVIVLSELSVSDPTFRAVDLDAPVYTVGDAQTAADLYDAIHSGARVGRGI